MDKLPLIIPSRDQSQTGLQKFEQLSPRPSAERLKLAERAATQMFSSYPDYGKAPAEYLVRVTEYIADLTDNEIKTILDPKTGVAATTKFLPTIADIAQCLVAEIERNKPAPISPPLNTRSTSYEYFQPANDPPRPSQAERKADVLRTLGYDPTDKKSKWRYEHPIVPLPEGWDASHLKSPDRPASDELKKLIEEGNPYT